MLSARNNITQKLRAFSPESFFFYTMCPPDFGSGQHY